jgi:hypothetical protein
MFRRRQPQVALVTLVAALGLPAAAAQAWIYTDTDPWSLNESIKTYGGPTFFHISSSGDGSAAFRWLDDTLTRTTIMYGSSCIDYSAFGSTTIGPGDDTYHTLFRGAGEGACFVLRGKTPSGSGSTTPHDGRVRR